MPDYAAAPIQPIVEGIVTFPGGPGTQPFFDGKGVSAITRAAGFPLGVYILTLDAGLPGNAGAVPFAASSLQPPAPAFPPDPDVRTMVTPITTFPAVAFVQSIGVSYIPSALSGVGAPQIEIVITEAVFLPFDPANGFQVVVWRGLGGGPVP
jgi:hypothetical protein